MGREHLELEFGRYAEWLADAISDGAPDDAIPAACRGTGNSALFERLAAAIGVDRHTRFLDVGCGIGGPAAWLARRSSCSVIGVDVMEHGIRGMKRLWPESRAVIATTRRLPFRAKAFDAGWALGVLETIADKSAALRDIDRVLAPGARFGVYTSVECRDDLEELPIADHFENRPDLERVIESAGFSIVEARPASDLPPPPRSWKLSSRTAREALLSARAGDPELLSAESEREKIARLYSSGSIEPWLFILESRLGT